MSFKEKVENSANYGLGITAGYASYRYLPKIIQKPYGKYVTKSFSKVLPSENDRYWNAAMNAYNNNPLLKNNIKIKDINHLNMAYIRQLIFDRCNVRKYENSKLYKSKIWKYFFGNIKDRLSKSIYAAATGVNAFCLPMNQIYRDAIVVVNSKKMAFSTFHEMGHALNKIGKGADKFFANIRGNFRLGVPIALAAGLLLNKPKDKESSEMSKEEKTRKWFKKNCGIIAGACMLPTVIEEGMASIKGTKIAKTVLDKNMCKKLNKLQFKAWCTYVLSALLTGAFVQSAVFVRDKIVDKKTFG